MEVETPCFLVICIPPFSNVRNTLLRKTHKTKVVRKEIMAGVPNNRCEKCSANSVTYT